MPWTCFLIVPTQSAEHTLRRYTPVHDPPCATAQGYHQAEVVVGIRFPYTGDKSGEMVAAPPHDDARWPTHCVCGYAFTAADAWISMWHRIWVRTDTVSSHYTPRRFPVGAVYAAPWVVRDHAPPTPADLAAGSFPSHLSPHYWRDWYGTRDPLFVQCPGGAAWCVDQRSSNGDGWVVTGTAPRLTATPSIALPRYHGYLRDGVLTDDLDGRAHDADGGVIR